MPNFSSNRTLPSTETHVVLWRPMETLFYLVGAVLMLAALLAAVVIVGFIVYVLGDIVLHIGHPHWKGFHLPWT